MQIPRIPFKILVLAPFLPSDHNSRIDKPIKVESHNLDQVIESVRPTFISSMPADLYPEENIEINIRKMQDFHPDGLIQNNPALRNIWEARKYLAEAPKKGLSSEEINSHLKNWPNLPPVRIDTEAKRAASSSRDAVDSILSMVDLPDAPSGIPSRPLDAGHQLDLLLANMLSCIYSDASFRALESCWRGLKLLLQHAKGNDVLRVEIMPVDHDGLAETLADLTAEMIETMPSLILIDLPFDSSPRSLSMMAQIAQLAETLLIPCVIWIEPGFFHLDSWRGLKNLPYLPHYLEESAYGKWQSLKKSSAARWLAAVCNRFLTRYPYGSDNQPRLVQFEEHQPLWTSPVWAVGCLIARSLTQTGWPTRFTDWQNIRLEDLALNTEDPNQPLPVEALFTHDRMDQFIRSGLAPLASALNKDVAFLPAAPVVGGASLSYQLLVSRVTQLILWCRDNIPGDVAGPELEAALQQAFALFWQASGHPGPEHLRVKAGEPETEGRIPLRIELQPSPRILASSEKVELEFFW